MALRFLVNSVERDDILTMPLDLAQVVAAEAHRAAKRVFANVFFPTVPMLVFCPAHPLCALGTRAAWRQAPFGVLAHKAVNGTKCLRTLLKNRQECLE